MSDLDRDLGAYDRMRERILREHGSVWALISEERLVETFADFSQAARYAIDHCAQGQFVIKHTDERLESAPFVGITG